MKINLLQALIAPIGLFIATESCGQFKEPAFDFTNLTAEIVLLPTHHTSSSIAVNSIAVVDMRYDNSTIGFYEDRYLVLGENFREEINQYENDSFIFDKDSTKASSIVLYVKSLWLSNELAFSGANSSKRPNYKIDWARGIACKMECFYKQRDVYHPLFRFDTTLITEQKVEAQAADLIAACLNRVNEKIISALATLNFGNTKMGEAEVARYYTKRFNVPILQDTLLKKGVYKSFSEFQNNKPFHGDFEVKWGELCDVLYLTDAAGNQTIIRDIWGYCDGKNLFVKSADNYFPMVKSGNSFYLQGFKEVERWEMSNWYGLPIGPPMGFGSYTTGANKYQGGMGGSGRVTYNVSYKPYQLNMENGEIY